MTTLRPPPTLPRRPQPALLAQKMEKKRGIQLIEHTLETDVPRLDLLVQALTQMSRSQVRGLFDHGAVMLDGQKTLEPGLPARKNSKLTLRYDLHTNYKPLPPTRVQLKFRVVWEDASLLVVEKIAGILTVPTDRDEDNTLLHEIGRYLSKSQRITKPAHVVHRLDRDTSGLLVFAKNPEVARALIAQFAARKPERIYAALVVGQMRENTGTFRSFLTTADDLDQYSTANPQEGKLAVTHFEVVERLKGATLLRVKLETGRRNQIRVHFAEIGHPVLGETRYEVARAKHPLWTQKRLGLHAQTLGFTHPLTGERILARSELPGAFVHFLQATRM